LYQNLRLLGETYSDSESFSGPVWILERDTRIVQQNSFAEGVSEKWLKKLAKERDLFDLKFANEKSDRFLELIGDAFEGNEKDLNLQIKTKNGTAEYWTFQVKPLKVNAEKVFVMVYAIDMTAINSKLVKMEGELETLRELALCPSHILRSPLSSMLGLLELIDYRKLDPENQRYISYLKPLAQELDDVIRSNAKKMAAFD
jgi:nitrogen-specific signal transduction histidine kinase